HDDFSRRSKDRLHGRWSHSIERDALNLLERQHDNVSKVCQQIERTTDVQPIKSARGRLRPGSFTSAPVKVTLFQADWAKRGPDIARPSIMIKARLTAVLPTAAKPRSELDGFHPLANGFHQELVNAAAPLRIPTFQPIVRPTTTKASSAAVLVKVKVF